jgi:predicted permease
MPLLHTVTDRAVDWELEHHIEERVERLVEEGWDPTEARAEAERRFGPQQEYRNELLALERRGATGRRMMGGMESCLRDLRGALRNVRRHPMFAGGFVLTLALGLGATTAIFSVVDAVVLRPLPYVEPDRLVEIWPAGWASGPPYMPSSEAPVVAEQLDVLEAVAYSHPMNLVRTDGEPEELVALAVSPDLDAVLGVEAYRGRTFGPDDVLPGSERVVLLTHGYWERTGADPESVGSTIRLEGEPWTVVGVLPADFKYPVSGVYHLWIPIASDGTAAGRTVSSPSPVGRLRDGVRLADAQARADQLADVLQAEMTRAAPPTGGTGEAGGADRAEPADWRVLLREVGAERVDERLLASLRMLSAAVALMLLLTIANATNLLLLRGEDRRREWGVRRALGASRLQVVRSALAETLVLAALAGGASAAIASTALSLLDGVLPAGLMFTSVHTMGVEGRAVGFALVAALVAGLATGIVPAARAARARSGRGVVGSRASGRDRRMSRLSDGLVVAEVTISVTLLVGAGLFLRSFGAMMADDPGFDAARVARADLAFPRYAYPQAPDRRRLLDVVSERLRALPGVEGVAVSVGAPPSGGRLIAPDALYPAGEAPIEQPIRILSVDADDNFLGVLGARLVEGRALTNLDREARGVVIDRDLARHLFGSRPAVGRRFSARAEDDPWTVVGVVEELKLGGIDDALTRFAMVQAIDPERIGSFVSLTIRARDPAAAVAGVRRIVRDVDPELPIRSLGGGRELMTVTASQPRFVMILLVSFAALATALGAIGTYAVLAHAVRQRRREIGIRIALGASSGTVQRHVLAGGMTLAVVGIALGLGASLLLEGVADGLLYGVAASDLWTKAGATLLMLTVAGLACWLPARRATRVDPVRVLNAE